MRRGAGVHTDAAANQQQQHQQQQQQQQQQRAQTVVSGTMDPLGDRRTVSMTSVRMLILLSDAITAGSTRFVLFPQPIRNMSAPMRHAGGRRRERSFVAAEEARRRLASGGTTTHLVWD